MQIADNTSLSRRSVALLLLASVFPVIAFMLARQLGFMQLVRLGALGAFGLAGLLLIFTRPRIGVFFMLVYVYAGLRFYLPGIVSVAVMGTIASAVLLDLMRGGKWRVTDEVFLYAVTLSGLIALQSMLWAHDLGQSLRAMSLFVKAVLLLILIVQVIRTPDDLRSFGKWIFFGCVATIVFGLANLALGIEQNINIVTAGLMRFMGTHANANYAAALMVSGVTMGLFYIKHERNPLMRFLALVGLVLLAAGVFSTFSRAAAVALVVVAVGVLMREIRSPRVAIGVIALVAIGVLVTPKFYWVRFAAVTDLSAAIREDWSFYIRVTAMREAWEMFLQHPLTGLGLSNFSVRSAGELIVRIGPHNMYLEILADLGIFGLLTYLAVHYAAFRHLVAGFRGRWQRGYEWLGDFSYYLMLTLISALVAGVFMDCQYTYLIWIPVAGALVLANIRKRYGA